MRVRNVFFLFKCEFLYICYLNQKSDHGKLVLKLNGTILKMEQSIGY